MDTIKKENKFLQKKRNRSSTKGYNSLDKLNKKFKGPLKIFFDDDLVSDSVNSIQIVNNKILIGKGRKLKKKNFNNSSSGNKRKIKRTSYKNYSKTININDEQYNELLEKISNPIDKIFLKDYKKGLRNPKKKISKKFFKKDKMKNKRAVSVYWPALKYYLFLKISDESKLEKLKSDIYKLKKSKYFLLYSYIIYIIDLKDNKKKYVHYVYIKYINQGSIIASRFEDWLLINKSKNPEEIIYIRAGLYGSRNILKRYFMYRITPKISFEDEVERDIKNLNESIEKSYINKTDIDKNVKLTESITKKEIEFDNQENLKIKPFEIFQDKI